MKTYIFIIRRICDITGAQQYVYNKMNYLESQGWRVLIFSSMKGHVLIDGFKRFERLILPSLYLSPACYRKSEVKHTIDKIINEIGGYDPDKTIIESDILQRAVWAELIALRLKCRHLCMFVQEKYKRNTDSHSLIQFKYDRHELSCITRNAIEMLFGEAIDNVRHDACFSAYCTNVVLDAPDRYSSLLNANADYTLGSLGRIGKPYVSFVVEAFRRYVAGHPDNNFNIVFIGDSSEKGKKEKIQKAFTGLRNVTLITTGNLYPVPISFAKQINVFVSTAGGSLATYNVGIPTVNVHPLTGEPVGVLGLDYMPDEKTMYESDPGMSIEECIDKALNNKGQIRFVGDVKEHDMKMKAEFKRQLTFVQYTDKKDYYPKEKLMKIKTSSHYPHFFLWAVGHFLGGKGQTKLWNLLRN